MTPIGRRDTRIIIQRANHLIDEEGSTFESWSTLATVWASVQTLTARESTNGNVRSGSTETLFSIRYQTALADLNPRDRIIWGTAVYDIASGLPIPLGRPAEILLTGVLVTDIAAITDAGGEGSLTHNGVGLVHDGENLEHNPTTPADALSHNGETLTHNGETLSHNE